MTELIIGDVRPRVQYTADGVQASFPYPFPIIDTIDLVVVFDDNQAPSAHDVTGVGESNGGDVVFDVAPASGTRITIYRDMAFARETDFQEAGDFRAAVINEELDRMAMLLQQAEMLVADSVHKPLYEADSDLVLPSAAARANKVLAFDEDGLPVVGTPSEEAASLAAASAADAVASAAIAQSEASFAINSAVPVQSLSGDGSTTGFTLERTVVSSTSIAVTIDGVKQHTGTYSASGTALTFSQAPPAGTDNIEVTFIGFVGLVSGLTQVPVSFRNRFINGDFRIATRGTSFATPASDDITLDRWGAGYANPSGVAVTISRQIFTPGQTDVPGEPEFYYRWDQTSAGTATELYPFQRIEDVRNLAGQSCTVSFWARADAPRVVTPRWRQNFGSGGSAEVTGNADAVTLTAQWQFFERGFTLPSLLGKTIGAGNYLQIDLLLPTGVAATIDLANVQIEQGTAASPFEYRPRNVELSLCQRYYTELAKSGSAWAVASSDVVSSVVFPVPMRAAPSVSLLDTTPTFNDYNVNSTSSGSTAPALNAVTDFGAQIRVNGFSGLVVSRPGFWNQTNPIWAFDAEL